MNQQYFDVIMQGGPVPGSSLTSDPDNPAPYEKPPEYTNIHEACQWIFSKFIEEENYVEVIQLMANDMPVMDITQVFLFSGFTEGKWDVNLMMLLAEPTAYILLALAERAGIDPTIFRGEEEDEAEEEVFFGNKISEEKLENLKKFKELGVQIPYLSEKDKNKIDSLPTAEQLDIEEEEEEQPQQEAGSLLSAPPPEEEVQA
jgi:hypothetical protein